MRFCLHARAHAFAPRLRAWVNCLTVCVCWLFLTLAGVAASSPAMLLDEGKAGELLRLLGPHSNSSDAATLNFLGRTYYALHDWNHAVQYCEQAVRLAPDNATFQLWLGRAYGEKANTAGPLKAFSLARKTLNAFQTAHQLDRNDMNIARDLGEYYALAPGVVGGGSSKALALADEIAPAHPADAAGLRALTYDKAGQRERAETAYRELIRLSHGSAASYLSFARFASGHHDWHGFDQNLTLALSASRLQAIDRYDAAALLLRAKRNLPEAVRQMRAYLAGHTVEEGPAFQAHYLLGEIWLAQGNLVQASEEFRAALALAPGYRPAEEALNQLAHATE